MKLFQAIQVYFAILGIKISQPPQKYPVNQVNFAILVVLVQCFVATTLFIFFDAESFKEIVDSYYPASSAITATLNFIVMICNSSKIFKLIENYENTMQSSKKYFNLCFFFLKSDCFFIWIRLNCVFINRTRKSSIEKNLRWSKSANRKMEQNFEYINDKSDRKMSCVAKVCD